MVLPLHEADTMCLISYRVDCGNIWSLKVGLIRHTISNVSLIILLFFPLFDQLKKQTLRVSKITVLIRGTFGI